MNIGVIVGKSSFGIIGLDLRLQIFLRGLGSLRGRVLVASLGLVNGLLSTSDSRCGLISLLLGLLSRLLGLRDGLGSLVDLISGNDWATGLSGLDRLGSLVHLVLGRLNGFLIISNCLVGLVKLALSLVISRLRLLLVLSGLISLGLSRLQVSLGRLRWIGSSLLHDRLVGLINRVGVGNIS